jgi:hypothetical protein
MLTVDEVVDSPPLSVASAFNVPADPAWSPEKARKQL